MSTVYTLYLAISRVVMPILVALLFFLWIYIFLKSRNQKGPVALMVPEFGDKIGEIYSGESLVGKSRRCEVRLGKSKIKKYALISLEKDGFYIEPLKGNVKVNDVLCEEKTSLSIGDYIEFDEEMYLLALPEDESESCPICKGTGLMMTILSVFQVILCGQIFFNPDLEGGYIFPASIGGLIAAQWIYFGIRRMKNPHAKMFVEVPLIYLMTLGLTVCWCCTPDEYIKQLICVAVGLVGAVVLRLILSDLSLVCKLRYVVASLAIALLIANLIFGTSVYGSKNWLDLGPLSFQPSEIVKIAYIFFGGVVLSKKELSLKGITIFLAFSAICMGALAIMVDFGAVAIFFVTMIILLLMRQASVWLAGGITLAAACGALGLIALFPHIAQRFAAWTNVWDYADSLGYQQTRTLIACASGGAFGVGAGNGHLKYIAAADTDLVFGIISEELGGIISFFMAFSFVLLAVYSVSTARKSRSSYYAETVCAAAGMLLFQTALNIFGSVDILPLTGVTIPFVSNGGTSLISGLCLMAFFKAAEVESALPEEIRRRYY